MATLYGITGGNYGAVDNPSKTLTPLVSPNWPVFTTGTSGPRFFINGIAYTIASNTASSVTFTASPTTGTYLWSIGASWDKATKTLTPSVTQNWTPNSLVGKVFQLNNSFTRLVCSSNTANSATMNTDGGVNTINPIEWRLEADPSLSVATVHGNYMPSMNWTDSTWGVSVANGVWDNTLYTLTPNPTLNWTPHALQNIYFEVNGVLLYCSDNTANVATMTTAGPANGTYTWASFNSPAPVAGDTAYFNGSCITVNTPAIGSQASPITLISDSRIKTVTALARSYGMLKVVMSGSTNYEINSTTMQGISVVDNLSTPPTTGILTVRGNISPTSSYGLINYGTSAINISGNITGGSSTSAITGLYSYNASTGVTTGSTITVTGNISGGTVTSCTGATIGAGTLIVSGGTVTSGSTNGTNGISVSNYGNITVNNGAISNSGLNTTSFGLIIGASLLSVPIVLINNSTITPAGSGNIYFAISITSPSNVTITGNINNIVATPCISVASTAGNSITFVGNITGPTVYSVSQNAATISVSGNVTSSGSMATINTLPATTITVGGNIIDSTTCAISGSNLKWNIPTIPDIATGYRTMLDSSDATFSVYWTPATATRYILPGVTIGDVTGSANKKIKYIGQSMRNK